MSAELSAPAVLRTGDRVIAGEARRLGVIRRKVVADAWNNEDDEDGDGGRSTTVVGAGRTDDAAASNARAGQRTLCMYMEEKCAHEEFEMLHTLNNAVIEMARWEYNLQETASAVTSMPTATTD